MADRKRKIVAHQGTRYSHRYIPWATNLGRRRLRRVHDGRAQLFPFGLIPLIGFALLMLYALFPFASGAVQKQAEVSAQRALDRAGLTWAKVDASGQWVTLRGEAPNPQLASQAIEVAATAKGQTWLGRAMPVTQVRSALTLPIVTPEPVIDPEPVETPDPEPAPVVTPRGHDWRFAINSTEVILEGDVPDQDMKTAVVGAVQEELAFSDIDTIFNRLNVTGEAREPGFETTTLLGVDAVMRCKSGIVEFADELLSINCQLPETDLPALEGLLEAPLAYGRLGTVDLVATEELTACERSLSRLLGETKIKFATGSASIAAESEPLLQRLAEATQSCPGILLVEGHTDSTGGAERNLALSRERAQAVRDALVALGVAPERLTANGFGETRPIASNDTGIGRATNRRIEIRVVRAGE